MTTFSQPTKGFYAFVAGIMAVTSLVLNIITWSRMNASISARDHALVVRVEWLEVLSQITDAETAQRGYHIVGDEKYLIPYDRALQQLPRTFSRLSQLLKGDPEGEADIARVSTAVNAKLDDLREAIVTRRVAGREVGRDYIESGRGKVLMDDLRLRIHEVMIRLNRQIEERRHTMLRDQKWGFISSLATGGVALGAGALAMWLVRDSFQQMRREERLALAKARAEQSEREKSIFLATMSHEIRTPLNAILGFSEVLATEASTDSQKRHAQAILAGGRSLLQIINDILDLSKIEAGMMPIAAEPCDVREIVRFVEQLFSRSAAEKGVTLRCETAPGVPPSLLLDGTRLRQILINVVGNAVKFTSAGSVTVSVGGEREHGSGSRIRLDVSVTDTGPGIAPEDQADIFKPFVQGPGANQASQRGTGLGLAIVKRLADLMGGRLTLHSVVGEGTTLAFEFPRVEISARLPQSQVTEETVVDFNQLRPAVIVAADDNPANRDLMASLFAGTHHTLHLAPDGAAALAAARTLRPDVVLMDVRMPEMDGREALRRIRSEPGLSVLPVIAVTASGLTSEEPDLRAAFDGYVRKPFSRADLYQQLAQFIPRVNTAPTPGDTPSAWTPQPGWQPLAADLRRLEGTMWNDVRAGMVMSDIHRFADALAVLARSAGCPPLVDYSAALHADANAFAVASLERRLADFPTLISRLEGAVPPATA